MPESSPFVLLYHVSSEGVHWDLMLDTGQTLATWQLLDDPAGLARGTGQTAIRARQIGEHRRAYLEYEGPLSADRGHVTRADQGSYTLLERRSDVWHVRMNGQLFRGDYHLTKNPDESWSLRCVSGS